MNYVSTASVVPEQWRAFVLEEVISAAYIDDNMIAVGVEVSKNAINVVFQLAKYPDFETCVQYTFWDILEQDGEEFWCPGPPRVPGVEIFLSLSYCVDVVERFTPQLHPQAEWFYVLYGEFPPEHLFEEIGVNSVVASDSSNAALPDQTLALTLYYAARQLGVNTRDYLISSMIREEAWPLVTKYVVADAAANNVDLPKPLITEIVQRWQDQLSALSLSQLQTMLSDPGATSINPKGSQ